MKKNPSNGRRVVARVWTDTQTDGQTELTKLIVSFHNFTKAPRNWSIWK